MPDVVQLNQRTLEKRKSADSREERTHSIQVCASLCVCVSVCVLHLSLPPVAVSAAVLSTCHVVATPSTFTCTSHPVAPIVSLTSTQFYSPSRSVSLMLMHVILSFSACDAASQPRHSPTRKSCLTSSDAITARMKENPAHTCSMT